MSKPIYGHCKHCGGPIVEKDNKRGIHAKCVPAYIKAQSGRIDKFCKKCNRKLQYNNKSGICQVCNGDWISSANQDRLANQRFCLCGCGIQLRKDNKTGYYKGHRPCAKCGAPVLRSSIECCSRECSAQLHWQRNPHLAPNRVWNAARIKIRNQNPDWRKNASIAASTTERKQKQIDSMMLKHGVPFGFDIQTETRASKEENLLAQFLPEFEQHQFVEGLFPDFVNFEKKQIVEYYGDYWHANPNKYDQNFVNRKGVTAQELWQKDAERIERFVNAGYDVLIIWTDEAKQIIKEGKKMNFVELAKFLS